MVLSCTGRNITRLFRLLTRITADHPIDTGPIVGKSLEGPLGHIVDITAVVAIVLGIAQTIWLGLASFSSGLYNITGAEWRIVDGETSTGSLLVALAVVMVCLTLSALSGDGLADGQIYAQSLTAQLYEVINIMLTPGMAAVMSVLIVILLLTCLVTSVDSTVLVINTIYAGGEAGAAVKSHIIIWGVILTAVIATLLFAVGWTLFEQR